MKMNRRMETKAQSLNRFRGRVTAAWLAGHILCVGAGLLSPPTAQAQTFSVLVKNTDQTAASALTIGNGLDQAQQFTTGDHNPGYTLGSVQIHLAFIVSNDQVRVSLYSDSSGFPGSSLHVLTNPSSITNSAFNTFSAPAGTHLTKETKYHIVVEITTSVAQVGSTTSDAEDTGAASGWSIANTRSWRTDMGSWGSQTTPLRIVVNGTAINTPATGEPTLTGGTNPGETVTAALGTIADVDRLPTFPDDYTFEWFRVDADDNSTVITGATSHTYKIREDDLGFWITVNVIFTDGGGAQESLGSASTRYPAAGASIGSVGPLTVPGQATPRVANTGQTFDLASYATTGTNDVAQQFTTGDATYGYTLGSVQLYLRDFDGSDAVRVSLYSDAFNLPGSSEHVLTNPSSIANNGFNTFTAPANSTLTKETMYHVVVEATSGEFGVGTTDSDAEDAGAASGWSIANTSLAKGTDTWTASSKKLRMAVNGSTAAKPLTDDGALRLVGGTVPHEGRLEIFHSSAWGTVCDDHWDLDNAQVACKALGYADGSDGSILLGAFFGPGTGSIHLDDVDCEGDELGLLACPRRLDQPVGQHDCSHAEDVSVRCVPGPPTITAAPALSDAPGGDGQWGPDETLTVTVTFSEAVSVTGGPPNLEVQFGDSVTRRAAYSQGSGTAALVFAYTLQSGDGIHASARVTANSLVLGGGLIRSVATGQNALLDHTGASTAGMPSTTLTAEFGNLPKSHRGPGHSFTFHLNFNHEIRISNETVRDDLLSVRARVDSARRLNPPSNKGWQITITPISHDDIVMTLPSTTDCTSPGAVCTSGGEKLSQGISARVPGRPGASVADARVREGPGATLEFVVTLNRPGNYDAVRYRTVDGTARAGEDYEAREGDIVFDAGVTTQVVSVPVIDDAIDEDAETMTLELTQLSNGGSYGIRIEDGTAVGTIVSNDKTPKAWTARFGRTVAEQGVDAVEQRFTGTRTTGISGTIARLNLAELTAEHSTRQGREVEAGWSAETPSSWPGPDSAREAEAQTLTAHDLLTQSSFALTSGSAESGFASVWGRGAITHFDGQEGEMTLDGKVSSMMVGADVSRDALIAGLMLGHSRGDGGYQSPEGNGRIEAALTTLVPYGRVEVSRRLSIWAMAGYGQGKLTFTPDDEPALEPDLSFMMGAVGAHNVLGTSRGATLTLQADAMAARTSTEAVSDALGGSLAASDADVTRLRLALEGSQALTLSESTVLIPNLELGVRHDGGDAETGFGVDVGAGLALSDTARGLSSEIHARGLLAHEAEGLAERGLSGTLAFDPAPNTERGLSVSLTQTMGGPSSGGADALLGRTTLAELGAQDDEGLDARRLDARIGYGFGVLEDRYTAIPEVGLGLSDTGREFRLGWRLAERVSTGLALKLGIEGTRREAANSAAGAEHGITVGAGWRLVGAGAESLELRVEGTRRDVGNDGGRPEHSVGAKLGVRW